VIVGIDPGLTGAVGVLDEDGQIVRVEDTPSFLLEGKRRDYDVPGMVRLLVQNGATGHIRHVFIERWQARPEASPQSMGKIGYGAGLWIGILSAFHMPHTVVWPQTWQRTMYQGAVGEGKERSLLIASRLWPNYKFETSRHDRADSLLIAEYGRRTLLGLEKRWEEIG